MSAFITGPLAHGAKTSIGTSEAALSSSTAKLNRGVVVKALATNPGIVYVGITGVTTSTGFPLYPGDDVTVEATSASQVYLIGSTTGNEVRWIGA